MKQFFSDFKKFISKGNILDMAVGVVIGSAFSKIVSSLVADIINPLIALLTGDVALSGMEYVLVEEILDESGAVTQAKVALTYGNFLQSVLDFLIIAFSIFVTLRIMMNAQKKLAELTGHEKQEAPAAPTTKTCPYCRSEISIQATRCPHCTSELEVEAEKEEA